jgi:hypothetical protein
MYDGIIAEKNDRYSRVTDSQKRHIISLLQGLGELVTVRKSFEAEKKSLETDNFLLKEEAMPSIKKIEAVAEKVEKSKLC